MKARIIEKTETENFQPITVEVTFESMDEVIDFYARANAPVVNISNNVPHTEKHTGRIYPDIFYKVAKPIYEKAKQQQQ